MGAVDSTHGTVIGTCTLSSSYGSKRSETPHTPAGWLARESRAALWLAFAVYPRYRAASPVVVAERALSPFVTKVSCCVSPTGWSRAARMRLNSEAERSRAGPNRTRRARVESLSDVLRVRHRVSRVRVPHHEQFLSSPPRAHVFRYSVHAANRAPGRLGLWTLAITPELVISRKR